MSKSVFAVLRPQSRGEVIANMERRANEAEAKAREVIANRKRPGGVSIVIRPKVKVT